MILGMLITLLVFGAILQGFYDSLVVYILGIVLYGTSAWMIIKHRQIPNPRVMFVLFLFVLLYGVSCLWAVDVEQALLEAGRVSLLLPWVFLASYLNRGQLVRIYSSLPWVGAGLVTIGLLFGLTRDGRLESLLEYANILAIFLLLCLCIGLYRTLQGSRWHLLLLVVNAVGLVLTYSRSVWILALFSYVVFIVMYRLWGKPRYMVYMIGLPLLAVGLSLGLTGQLGAVWDRMLTIGWDAAELRVRLVYWQDSLELIQSSWWLGLGGGGWNLLQHIHQSEWYYVRYIHNHYIQLVLDVGVAGLALFLLWVTLFYLRAIKLGVADAWTKLVVLMVSVLLIHAGFDFDLSLPWMLFILASLMLYVDAPTESPAREKEGLSRAWRLSLVALATGVVVGCLWFAIGYDQLGQGKYDVELGRGLLAEEHLKAAARILPWSHEAQYNLYKAYVLLGNETADSSYYLKAEQSLVLALEKVPDHKLYRDTYHRLQQDLKSIR